MRLCILLFVPLLRASCPTDLVCDESFNNSHNHIKGNLRSDQYYTTTTLNRCYKYVSDSQPYFTAEENCVSLGGHLVSIQNAFESAVIGESAASMFNGYDDYWIGANYVINEKWSWTDGTTWSYIDWFPGEPSAETCASMLLKNNEWTTALPNSRKPYVCELPFSAGGLTCPTATPCPTQSQSAVCPTDPHKPRCESGLTLFEPTNACYKVGFNQQFWAAENECVSWEGHLVSIQTEEENDFVSNLAYSGHAVLIDDCTWFGMYRVNGQFYWTDKSAVNYLNWGPNDYSDGDCVLVYAGGFLDGPGWINKWQSDDCSRHMRNFVCEKPAE